MIRPNRKHIKEDMLQGTMHEHVCEQLIRAEVACQEEMESQHIVKVQTISFTHYQAHEAEHIDN